jgi:hypothetical protein
VAERDGPAQGSARGVAAAMSGASSRQPLAWARGSPADHVGSESTAPRLGGFPEHFEHARVHLQPAADTIFERGHGQ